MPPTEAMITIPPAVATDAEDVAWALQTADTLWKRNERVDAIVWLRRAAQAAGEAQDDDRALALAREAAELSDYIAKNPLQPGSDQPPSGMAQSDSATGAVDDLLRSSMPEIPIDVSQGSLPVVEEVPEQEPQQEEAPLPSFPLPLTPPPPRPVTPLPPLPPMTRSAPPTPITPVPPSEASVAVFQSVASDRSEAVQSAAEKHAGLLDPWAVAPEEELAVSKPGPLGPIDDDDDVVTSARLELPRPEPGGVIHTGHISQPAPPPLPKSKPRMPATAIGVEDSGVVSSLPQQAASAVIARETEEFPTMEVKAVIPEAAIPPRSDLAATKQVAAATAPPVVRFPVEQTLVSAGVVKASTVDLSKVDALADLPDDARAELQANATVHRLAREEEVMGFALAYVVEGEVDVAAQIVDAPADRLRPGAILKAKGTVAESVPLRLIAATDDAVVATWDSEQIEPAFKTCPWVEDDLRASANRMQALVGITMGSLAERLDTTLRAQFTAKLELRELGEGDVIIEKGQPIKEMAIVGQGSIELVSDGNVVGEVKVGEFLFPAEILGGGTASASARAGKGGALLLASDRNVAQELMVTCPPLLEIFAGM